MRVLAGVAGSLIGKYSTPYKCAKAWLMVEELEVDAGGVLFAGCGDVLQPDRSSQALSVSLGKDLYT